MKPFRWSPEKNQTVKAERGISFESVVVSIEAGGLLDILAHPKQAKYSGQRVLVVACDNYAYLVPFIEEEDYFFLETVIPGRKATRDYLNQGEADAEN
ncbi:MAG: toxin [Sulfuritalea sp.]|nr:toxin [Sulfuritalea sp.]